MAHNNEIEITGNEAEIERYGKPMLRYHQNEIINGHSQFNGIILVSKNLLTNKEMIEFKSYGEIPIYFALENSWL